MSNVEENLVENFSDRDLIRRCKECGDNARRWSREFAYLLPEVMRRGLHRRCGCESIFHFAAKYAGMSREVVERILSLYGKLKNRPVLWAKIRECGWTKLKIIAGLDTPEGECVQLLKTPNEALRVVAQKIRKSGPFAEPAQSTLLMDKPISAGAENFETRRLDMPENESPVFATGYSKIQMNVSAATELEFKSLKLKFEKERKKALTNGEALKILMEKLKAYEKRKPVQNVVRDQASPAKSRYINVSTRQALTEKYGVKCASPWCKNPSLESHHPGRFAKVRDHKNVKPLCRTCHQLAHFGFIKNEQQEVEKWELTTQPEPNSIDLKVQQHWRAR